MAFRNYVNLACAMHRTKVANLRTDCGSEFTSLAFKKFCDDRGIDHQRAEVNIHQHNAVPEITNKLVMQVTRCIMIYAGVPRHWFEDAIMHAVFLLNHIPCASIDYKTRVELWRAGQVPDLRYIRVFGCVGYAYDEKYKNKLGPKIKSNDCGWEY